MSPGPTEIEDNVLEAMATKGTNPDLDPAFYERYKGVVSKYNQLIGTQNATSLLLAGEAILGLEAACSSTIEPGDKVLCISNGFFGAGFKGFIEMYGGIAVLVESSWHRGVTVEDIRATVEANPDIKLATMVHCETPTGITNQVAAICQYLHEKNILSIVDSVSAIGGEKVSFDSDKIDILLGGSQKCLSAPSGMTLVTLSDRAIAKMKQRKSPIVGYYTNLANWLGWYDRKWFPYTQSLQNIYGLEQAIDNLLKKDAVAEHSEYAVKVRKVMEVNGLKLYGQTELSNTVTAVMIPNNLDYDLFFTYLLEEHKILIGGCLGDLKGKVFRIGHMGANNKQDNFVILFKALDHAWNHFNLGTSCFESSFKEL
jgi:aspartate aminotransferase-like enzyme